MWGKWVEILMNIGCGGYRDAPLEPDWGADLPGGRPRVCLEPGMHKELFKSRHAVPFEGLGRK